MFQFDRKANNINNHYKYFVEEKQNFHLILLTQIGSDQYIFVKLLILSSIKT